MRLNCPEDDYDDDDDDDDDHPDDDDAAAKGKPQMWKPRNLLVFFVCFAEKHIETCAETFTFFTCPFI